VHQHRQSARHPGLPEKSSSVTPAYSLSALNVTTAHSKLKTTQSWLATPSTAGQKITSCGFKPQSMYLNSEEALQRRQFRS